MQQFKVYHFFLVIIMSNCAFKCNNCLTCYRFLCKVTSETLTPAMRLVSWPLWLLWTQENAVLAIREFTVDTNVCHYMGGKDSRCVASHDVWHVTVVSCMPLVGKAAIVK